MVPTNESAELSNEAHDNADLLNIGQENADADESPKVHQLNHRIPENSISLKEDTNSGSLKEDSLSAAD